MSRSRCNKLKLNFNFSDISFIFYYFTDRKGTFYEINANKSMLLINQINAFLKKMKNISFSCENINHINLHWKLLFLIIKIILEMRHART